MQLAVRITFSPQGRQKLLASGAELFDLVRIDAYKHVLKCHVLSSLGVLPMRGYWSLAWLTPPSSTFGSFPETRVR